MAKPIQHGDRWRIRWLDERGKRQSAVYDDYKRAQLELRRRQVEVAEIRRGIRNAAPPDKTFDDLFDYWLASAHRASAARRTTRASSASTCGRASARCRSRTSAPRTATTT